MLVLSNNSEPNNSCGTLSEIYFQILWNKIKKIKCHKSNPANLKLNRVKTITAHFYYAHYLC